MAELVLEGVGRAYGATWAVRELSLTIRNGEFVTLLGPSGCGKTTTLRMIAGFVAPTAGRIVLGGRVLSAAGARAMVPPERRGMGMVFQHYAVWPHLTAAQNVAYPLRRARLPRAEIERRTLHALEMVHLAAHAARHPGELSGGQQQRVALARALVMEPVVLLLDEPLSNLDARLREEMRVELLELHARLGLTVVYVTHDQAEAMALSGRIAVLLDGRCAQVGTPEELYDRPASPAVAAFVGAVNLLPAEVDAADGRTVRFRLSGDAGGATLTVPAPDREIPAGRAVVGIRPEAFDMTPDGSLRGRVERVVYLGSRVEYVVRIGTLTVRVDGRPPASARPDQEIGLTVLRALLFPGEAGRDQRGA